MRIVSRFNGKCSQCGDPIPKGTEIEYINKAAFHPFCFKEEERDYDRIADELHFLPYDAAIQFLWSSLRTLPGRTGIDSEGRTGEAQREPDTIRTLFSGIEGD